MEYLHSSFVPGSVSAAVWWSGSLQADYFFDFFCCFVIHIIPSTHNDLLISYSAVGTMRIDKERARALSLFFSIVLDSIRYEQLIFLSRSTPSALQLSCTSWYIFSTSAFGNEWNTLHNPSRSIPHRTMPCHIFLLFLFIELANSIIKKKNTSKM